MKQYSRRSVLRTTGGIAGTVAAASVAGCSSLPFLGGGGASYSGWLYEPGTFADETNHYTFFYTRPSSIASNEDEFGEDVYESRFSSESQLQQLADIGNDETNWALGFQASRVLSGSYSVSDVESNLGDEDWDDDDDVGSYTIWIGPNERQAVGVSGGNLVLSSPFRGEDAANVVETVINTKRGNEARYKAENDDFSTLLNKLGSGDIVSGSSNEAVDSDDLRDNQVASGGKVNFNGSTTKTRSVSVYESSDDIDLDDFEDRADDIRGRDQFDEGDYNLNVNKSGRAVVAKLTYPTDEYPFNFGFF